MVGGIGADQLNLIQFRWRRRFIYILKEMRIPGGEDYNTPAAKTDVCLTAPFSSFKKITCSPDTYERREEGKGEKREGERGMKEEK